MEIVGIGNALMDVIAFVDEAFAPRLGFHNNTVVHLERARLGRILEELPDAIISPGGGAANAARMAAYLGADAAYSGMVGEDSLGRRYAEGLRASGVEALLSFSDAETGVYCALIRPDGGRTLLVSPAAALDLNLEPPQEALFRKGAILFAESFLLRDRNFFMECLCRARGAGMETAIDLSSRELTARNRDFILAYLPEFCDLLFANEDEFVALTELPLREGLELVSQWGIEVIVKRAEMGAVWASAGRIAISPVREMRPVDETGAGDAFAAAYLYGRSLGLAPERCLRLGNRVAEEVLGVPGFGVDPDRIRRAVESLLV
jgi:sugar/nucleoside kinase (ribokinase family)